MIKPESEIVHTIKLSNRSIEARKIVVTRESTWKITLDASVSIRRQARGLHGENLVRGQLLLIKCLLLLLKGLDLALDGNLWIPQGQNA